MQAFRRWVLAPIAITVALSLSAAPREPKQQKRQPQQKQGSTSSWMRLIHKIVDDVIPPPDNRFSIPPG